MKSIYVTRLMLFLNSVMLMTLPVEVDAMSHPLDTTIALATVFPEHEDRVGKACQGERIFVDREYVFAELPSFLSEAHYLVGSMADGNRIVPVTEGTVLMVTPLVGQEGSQEEALLADGFERVFYPSFTLFEGQGVSIGVFKKEVKFQRFRLKHVVYDGWAVPFFNVSELPSFATPAEVVWSPDNEYAIETRLWQGCPSIDRTGSRLWGAWFSGGTREPDVGNYGIVSYRDPNTEWVDPAMVIVHPDTNVRVMDTQLWTDPNGSLWVFWVQNTGPKGFDGIWGTWAIRIDNPEADEPIWTEPRRLCHGLTRNKPIVLSSGEWLLPSYDWISHQSAVYISEDEGKNWTLQGGPFNKPTSNFYEHMCVQLKDGNIWMLQRNIQESLSTDKGKTWISLKKVKGLASANSRVFISRLRSGNLLLIYNDSTQGKKRKNLTARLSTDEGKTWSSTLLLDERDDVSYPDMVQDEEGIIYVCYDRSRRGEKEILLATFTEEDIVQGQFAGKQSRQKELISKGKDKK
ncbi:exo-alpha-sialidase [Sphingobacterium haloxyli]|nr:sialidase family protein [Sphingobacterium haloxyli]